VVARVRSGWVVMGESQLLPGYCLLLPDPVVGSLNELSSDARADYLRDMALVGDAVEAVCSPRRINYEMLGNLEPALHAHVIPRYHNEPEKYRTGAVWAYPPELWGAGDHRFDAARAEHAKLRELIGARLIGLGAATGDGAAGRVGGATLFSRACAFAARAHAGQVRKDGRTPYISHPLRVAMIVRHEFGCDDEAALAAAALHDTIEDSCTDYDELLEEFGADVADLVAALTKDMRLVEPARERAYDEQLSRADWRARLVKLADVLDNLRDLPGAGAAAPTDAREKCRRALAVAGPMAQAHPALSRACAAVGACVN